MAKSNKNQQSRAYDVEHEIAMAKGALACGLAAMVCTLACVVLSNTGMLPDYHPYIAAAANLLAIAGIVIGMWCRLPLSDSLKTTGLIASTLSLVSFALLPLA